MQSAVFDPALSRRRASEQSYSAWSKKTVSGKGLAVNRGEAPHVLQMTA